MGSKADQAAAKAIIYLACPGPSRSRPPLRPPTEHGPRDAERRRRNQAPGVTTGEAEAGAEVVEALVAGKVAGVLSGADQASYLLGLQIALHPTNHDCTTRGATPPPAE